jgi:hypothetical protein
MENAEINNVGCCNKIMENAKINIGKCSNK